MTTGMSSVITAVFVLLTLLFGWLWRQEAERERRWEELVREIMTHRVLCVTPATTVAECMVLMTEKKIRHLPVMDNGKLVGFISIGDVVKSIIAEQEYLIEHLENYIVGR